MVLKYETNFTFLIIHHDMTTKKVKHKERPRKEAAAFSRQNCTAGAFFLHNKKVRLGKKYETFTEYGVHSS